LQRKLTVIVSADVVGYSGLMERDEAGTLAQLKANRKAVFDPCVAKHGGRIVKLMGDGALVEFASVVSAVSCAHEIQRGTEGASGAAPAERIRYRIGINLGEVIVEGDDIYGDGVNVAARLQGLAEPGSITCTRCSRRARPRRRRRPRPSASDCRSACCRSPT
jgi:class 3 adenylate cyclase